jgi:hypothetical protein
MIDPKSYGPIDEKDESKPEQVEQPLKARKSSVRSREGRP